MLSPSSVQPLLLKGVASTVGLAQSEGLYRYGHVRRLLDISCSRNTMEWCAIRDRYIASGMVFIALAIVFPLAGDT